MKEYKTLLVISPLYSWEERFPHPTQQWLTCCHVSTHTAAINHCCEGRREERSHYEYSRLMTRSLLYFDVKAAISQTAQYFVVPCGLLAHPTSLHSMQNSRGTDPLLALFTYHCKTPLIAHVAVRQTKQKFKWRSQIGLGRKPTI